MLSVPAGLTVTSDRYQPPPPSVPAVAASAAVGPVLSSFTVSGAAFVLRPASFVQEPLNSCPVVSVVCDWSAVHVTGLEIESVPSVSTVTSLVYQPFDPSVPAVTASAAVGPVLSGWKGVV